MNCREAIQEAFKNKDGTLTTQEVIGRIYAEHPEKPWKKNTMLESRTRW